MRRPLIVSLAAGFGIAVSIVAFALATATERKPVESLFARDSVVFLTWEGLDTHRAAWEQTAAYESLEKSGLVPTLVKLALSYIPTNNKVDATAIRDTLNGIARKGLSLGVSFGDGPVPRVVLVVHDAGALEPLLTAKVQALSPAFLPQATPLRGRKVVRVPLTNLPAAPDADLAWWAEGGHLVLVFGPGAVNATLDLAEGHSPGVSASPSWKRFHGDKSQTLFCGWLDAAALKTKFASYVLRETPRLTVGELVRVLGLDHLGAIGGRCEMRDKALVTETLVDCPAPRTGVLALANQRAITLAEAPPLPQDEKQVTVVSFDWAKAYDTVLEVARAIGDAVEPRGSESVNRAIASLPASIGIDLRKDLFEPLGDVTCLFGDASTPLPGSLGFGLAIKVDDAETLRKTLKTVAKKLEATFPGLNIAEEERAGRQISVFDLGQLPVHPALGVDKQWLFIGLSPQAIEADLLRLDGKLEHWTPSAAQQAALDFVPKSFLMLSLSDPQPGYSNLLTFLPVVITGIEQSMKSQEGTEGRGASMQRMSALSELPPIELVTRALFPNVSTWAASEKGLESKTRESAPQLMPGTAVTAVGVALVLPAVQAARSAARRTQSKNNLKQIMLAEHNYHQAHGAFTPGTVPNKTLQPAERLSWQVELLPYLEQQNLYNSLNRDKGWNDPANRPKIASQIGVYLNPGALQATNEQGLAATHYVGLAGLGAEGPTLPVTSVKAGCFGYDRATRLRDITDGMSSTLMISEASGEYGSWGAGGRATLRPLTKKPYLNGPDGIGGPYPGGVQMGYADGSVRLVSDSIDPRVLESLVTISAGDNAR